MADVLPGFTFDSISHRYRSGETGRYVARRDIANLLETHVNGMERRLGDLVTAAYEGRISGSTFLEQFSTELRRGHSANAALASGGWDQMNSRAWGRVGGHLENEYARAVDFATAIESKDITLAQALARSNMYAGSARVEYFEALQATRAPVELGRVGIERRTLAPVENCSDCVGYYEQGWTIAGSSLPPPGVGSQCRSNCKCLLHYKEVPANELADWLGTKR